jgi:hypothetical protein
MSDLRLDWTKPEQDLLLETRLRMLDKSPMEVFEVFKAKNIRKRTINAFRPKLRDLDVKLGKRAGKRAKPMSKPKSMWSVALASSLLTKQEGIRKA